jgi:hypothetical protein
MDNNKGKKWDLEEENQLKKNYNEQKSISAIAKIHGRTRGAIRLRLEKLNMLEPNKNTTDNENENDNEIDDDCSHENILSKCDNDTNNKCRNINNRQYLEKIVTKKLFQKDTSNTKTQINKVNTRTIVHKNEEEDDDEIVVIPSKKLF